jgi:hypothetical protein
MELQDDTHFVKVRGNDSSFRFDSGPKEAMELEVRNNKNVLLWRRNTISVLRGGSIDASTSTSKLQSLHCALFRPCSAPIRNYSFESVSWIERKKEKKKLLVILHLSLAFATYSMKWMAFSMSSGRGVV